MQGVFQLVTIYKYVLLFSNTYVRLYRLQSVIMR